MLSKVATQFADRDFELVCPVIRIRTRRTPRRTFKGPGEIRLQPDGRLTFRFFLQGNASALHDAISVQAQAGSLLPDDSYFDLRATDIEGRTWRSRRLRPNQENEHIVTGGIGILTHRSPSPISKAANAVILRVPSLLELPWNERTAQTFDLAGKTRHQSLRRNAAVIQAIGCEFRLYHESKHTMIVADSLGGPLNSAMGHWMQEALQFLLGTRVHVATLETYRGGKYEVSLYRGSSSKLPHRIRPPLYTYNEALTGDLWEMFAAYIKFLTEKSRPRGWNTVSQSYADVIDASALSLEAEVKTLTIASEGAITLLYPKIATVPRKQRAELKKVRKVVAEQSIGQDTKARLDGFFKMANDPGAKARLKAFVASRNLDERLVKLWDKLRHPVAHGRLIDRESRPRIRQELYSVYYLFYRIILERIGYVGHVTDYSSSGWPVRKVGEETAPKLAN